jgi:hypothetical protein
MACLWSVGYTVKLTDHLKLAKLGSPYRPSPPKNFWDHSIAGGCCDVGSGKLSMLNRVLGIHF